MAAATRKKKAAKKKHAKKKKAAKKTKKSGPKKKVTKARKTRRKKRTISASPVQEKPVSKVYQFYEEGLGLLHQKKYKQARARLIYVMDKFPQEIEVAARAKSLLKVCEKNLQTKAKPGTTAEELFHRGVVLHNTGEYENALDCYSRALKASKKKGDHIYYAIAATEATVGDVDNALKHLQKAIEIKEENRYFANNDPDFELLTTNQKFQKLIHPE